MMLAELMRAGKDGVRKKRRKDQMESTTPAAMAGERSRKLGMGCLDLGKRSEA